MKNASVEELEKFVKQGASLNEVDRSTGFTPVHTACYYGALEVHDLSVFVTVVVGFRSLLSEYLLNRRSTTSYTRPPHGLNFFFSVVLPASVHSGERAFVVILVLNLKKMQ